jgi:hypothetical protein
MFARKMTIFLLLSLQIEWPDLKDRDDPGQMFTYDCSFQNFRCQIARSALLFLPRQIPLTPKQNGPNGAGGSRIGAAGG